MSTSAIKPRQTMRGHTSRVLNVVHLPGGRRIITCSNDGSLRIWDLESGAQIGDDLRDDGAGVLAMALSPNGKTVAAGSANGTTKLWDVETEKVITKWIGHTSFVSSVCWSADGERVVSGSWDGTARVWDVESGKTVLGPIQTGHKYLNSVTYSPDATKIATGGENENAIKIWDAKTGELLSTLKHSETWSLTWTSDQKKLISGSSNGSIRIFDTATWQQIAILEGHERAVNAISFSRSDRLRLLASASCDKTARLWNLDTNLPVGPPLQHGAIVNSAVISADGKLLVTSSDDRNVYVWDIHTILRLKGTGLEGIQSIPYDLPAGELLMDKEPGGHCAHAESEPILRNLSGHITKTEHYPVARGGFGEIWKCIYHEHGGPIKVAVKALIVYAADQLEGGATNERKLKRILRELKTGAKLLHRNILPVYGYTYGFGMLVAMVSPWAEKGSLTAYLQLENGTLTTVRQFEILRDISAGLHYLHANDIVHGDLTGPNVLIYDDGTACLCDFGLSLVLSEVTGNSFSITSTLRGNCRWMAPELLNVQENAPIALPSKISDIYSFGGLMLHVLTGQVPYYYLRNDAQVITSISNRIKPCRLRYSPISDRYWHFVEQCWETVTDRPSIKQVVNVITAELYFASVIEPRYTVPYTHTSASSIS